MAQFTIKMPQDLLDLLNGQVKDVALAQQNGELPAYPLFNRNLMKNMNTPAEELHHAATGISGEAGEILDISKKVWVYNKALDVPHMIEELGDLRFYYQSMLALFNLTDDQIVASNMVKLRKRYADGKYSDAQANARADKNPAAEGISSSGSTGTAQPAPRKFLGQPVDLPPAAQAAAARQEGSDPDNIGERE